MDLWDSCDQTEDIFVLTHRRCLLGKDLTEVPFLLSPTLSETELSIAKTLVFTLFLIFYSLILQVLGRSGLAELESRNRI